MEEMEILGSAEEYAFKSITMKSSRTLLRENTWEV